MHPQFPKQINKRGIMLDMMQRPPINKNPYFIIHKNLFHKESIINSGYIKSVARQHQPWKTQKTLNISLPLIRTAFNIPPPHRNKQFNVKPTNSIVIKTGNQGIVLDNFLCHGDVFIMF